MFQNDSFVDLLEVDLSPIRALCLLTLFVELDLVWELGWKISLQKVSLVLFSRYIEPSFWIFSAVVFLNTFLESFFNGSDVHTIRHHMKKFLFLRVDRKNLLCVSQLTQQRNRYRRGT